MPHSTARYLRFALPALLAAAGLAVAPTASAARRQTHHAHARGGYVQLLVKVRRHARIHGLGRQLRRLHAGRVRTLGRLHVLVVRVPRRTAPAALRLLRESRAVRYAERNRAVLHVTDGYVQAVPSDPLWPQQWGPAQVQAPTGWAVTQGSPSVVVAVLDTGADLSQPDLQGAFVPGYDFVNNDADPTDDHGHGTGTAGIVGARVNNGTGISGMCPRCSIMPVKVAAADGSATELNVAQGITWATDHGARVISMSLGGTYGAAVADAVKYAAARNVLVVAAAGNNGNTTPFYPAADPGALSVAATQPDDQLYQWSNFGSWVAVAAPGCDVTTLRGGGYGEFCGTSAAAPVVSGLAALAMSYSPLSSAAAIAQAITSSAHHVAGVTYGRIDAAGTLAALGATFAPAPPAPPPPPPPAPDPTVQPAPPVQSSPAPTPARRPAPGRRARTSVSRRGWYRRWERRRVVATRRARARRQVDVSPRRR